MVSTESGYNLTHIYLRFLCLCVPPPKKVSKSDKSGKKWQKLAKSGKIGKIGKKWQKVAKVAKSGNSGKNCQNPAKMEKMEKSCASGKKWPNLAYGCPFFTQSEIELYIYSLRICLSVFLSVPPKVSKVAKRMKSGKSKKWQKMAKN